MRCGLSYCLMLPFLLSISACQRGTSDKPATISGMVMIDGAPLPSGQIEFHDPEGQIASAGADIREGKYSTKAKPGTMRVEITDYREVAGKFDTSNPGVRIPLREQYVPARYNKESELQAVVKSGSNQFDFELKEKVD